MRWLPLNPLRLALCWNSHRLSKQSNSGSIRPSIGGIETELVVSRGGAGDSYSSLLQGGGLTHTIYIETHNTHIYIYTDGTAEDLVCVQYKYLRTPVYRFMNTHSFSSPPAPAETRASSGHAGTSAFIPHEQIQVLSVQVGAVCQQFVSK